MGKNSKIQWTDHTFNPWVGCTKVSPGCANCYAENLMDKRLGKVRWGMGQPRKRTGIKNWNEPKKWNREAAELEYEWASEAPLHDPGELVKPARPRVFCASLADWLDDEVPIRWLVDLLDLVRRTPSLDWLLLTKRPRNWATRIEEAMDCARIMENSENQTFDESPLARWLGEWIHEEIPPKNIWLGTSVESQPEEWRIHELLEIPAYRRFLSMEPLLGPVDLTAVKRQVAPGFFGDCLQWYHRGKCYADDNTPYPKIDWVIVGGESGPRARPVHPDWVRSIRDQCIEAAVPFFFKQWGEFKPIKKYSEDRSALALNERWLNLDGGNSLGGYGFNGKKLYRIREVGKELAGRILDNREWDEIPGEKQ